MMSKQTCTYFLTHVEVPLLPVSFPLKNEECFFTSAEDALSAAPEERSECTGSQTGASS